MERRTFLQQSGLLVASVAAISVEGVDAFLQRAASLKVTVATLTAGYPALRMRAAAPAAGT